MAAKVVDTSRSANAALRPIPIDAVHLTGGFWAERLRINREVTIPTQYERLESTGRIDNFRVASSRKSGEFVGAYYNDSDVYKWLEAAAWTLAGAALSEGLKSQISDRVDRLIDDIAAAQQPDGYLNSYFMFERAKDRWSNLRDKHELYCAGHLIQAAVAHHRTADGRKLLDVATRLADHICGRFGPAETGRCEGACGHPEIEMALVELFRTTREPRYLDQARYFLDARGRGLVGSGEYHQDHKPVREVDRVVGHAVRQLYLACGMTDACLEDSSDNELANAVNRLWSHFTDKQMYVTGGAGARHDGESFGDDFELPNDRAYAETCAAIASVMWNWRLLLLTGEARYGDLIERTLYNAVLPGVSLDGREYFYVNPLADDGTHRRKDWFQCACCPPNLARLIAQLPGYFYSTLDDADVCIHQFASSVATVRLGDGRITRIEQITDYPWDGRVTIRMLDSIGVCRLRIREPGANSYVFERRDWKAGDELRLEFPMDVHLVRSHPKVAGNTGRVAVTRGPLVYCAEAIDNPGVNLDQLDLRHANFKPNRRGDLAVLRSDELTLIPYSSWANREPGAMAVWLHE